MNRIKAKLKTQCSTLYRVAREIKKALKNDDRETLCSATHDAHVSAVAPLSKLYIPIGPKRINLVFSTLDKEAILKEETQKLLIDAIKFANKAQYEVRIITRNQLPDPKIFVDFLKKEKLEVAEKYSFYTDCSDRMSNSVRRLEVSENDEFFFEGENKKMERWTNENK